MNTGNCCLRILSLAVSRNVVRCLLTHHICTVFNTQTVNDRIQKYRKSYSFGNVN